MGVSVQGVSERLKQKHNSQWPVPVATSTRCSHTHHARLSNGCTRASGKLNACQKRGALTLSPEGDAESNGYVFGSGSKPLSFAVVRRLGT